MLSAGLALDLTVRLSGLNAIIQGLEYYQIAIQQRAFGTAKFNLLRLVLAVWLMATPNSVALFALLGLHLFTLLQWRGAFNGGSDAMTTLVLIFSAIGWLGRNRPDVVTLALAYIAFQLGLSYFKAGWAKICQPHWRSGIALAYFLRSPIYQPLPKLSPLVRSQSTMRSSAWFILIFELSFPISALRPSIAAAYLAIGLAFHLLNAYLFGLNRFLFAWVAAYPALLYCSSLLTHQAK